MDSEQLISALDAAVRRLVSLATEDDQLRTDLCRLAEAFLAIDVAADQPVVSEPGVEEPQVDTQPTDEAISPAVTAETAAAQEPAVSPDADASTSPPVVLPELTLGQAKRTVEPAPVSYPVRWETTATDLAVIESRCRLKAEAARWAASRRRLMKEGADFPTEIEPRDREIISRAKAMKDCFLWMCHPSGPSPLTPALYDDVARSFDVVADILSIVRQIEDDPDLHRGEFEHAVDLLAEAQSALRMAIATIDGPTDTDQLQVFIWLRTIANERQIFIQRYMRIDDPADPDQWADRSSRIEALDSQVQETRVRHKKRSKLLGKVRHKTSLLAGDAEGDQEQWQSLIAVVEELVSDGLPPSNSELRELLVPVIDGLPDQIDVPAGFQLVLRELDRFMATYPASQTKSAAPPPREVQAVADLLKDKSLVLVGGERRGAAGQALQNAFGLKELIWIEAREHESIDGFEAYIARPDVVAVLLAIRWASHSHGDIKAFCDRYGKPMVRLPGGYNTNQVAAQIMAQCSGRLTGT